MSDPGDEMWGFEDWPPDEPEFCLIHGYEHMNTDRGPIAYCTQCDAEQEGANETACD